MTDDIQQSKPSTTTRVKMAGSNQKDQTISTSSSIVARVGQIMAIIITLGVFSMIASMLVSESLSGDAAQINRAGALRMQAIKISRAVVFYNTQVSGALNNDIVVKDIVVKEVANFEQRVTHLFEGGVTNALDDEKVNQQYGLILSLWSDLNDILQDRPESLLVNSQPLTAIQSITLFDQFVEEINQLVTILQFRSEKKLELLRLIQGISLFVLMIIAFVVLYRLNRNVIVPLKQLVTVAEQAGKGDFSLKATYDADNELGVLSRTINQMSMELELTYQDYQQRVESKTKALVRSNRSLQVLYKAASQLASNEAQQTDSHIVKELEAVLGSGKITIERIPSKSDKLVIDILQPEISLPPICLKQLCYPLEKNDQHFGSMVWHIPNEQSVRTWQTQMLQAMADIVATAIDLGNRRNTENRLLIAEERAVIARELHDSLAQSLSYLKVQMSLLTRKIQKDVAPENIDETIEDIKQGLNAAYRQLRELLTTFRLQLDDPSLNNALQGTVVEFAEKCQHDIELKFQLPESSFTANQEIHVLQIIREALSNVHRHANADKAGVALTIKDGKRIVEIWDDGIGIKNLNDQPGHFGLGIMRERAKSLNTEIRVEPKHPKGTRILFKF